jgi:hypothetical protein
MNAVPMKTLKVKKLVAQNLSINEKKSGKKNKKYEYEYEDMLLFVES